jgi:hypothetical protein
MSNYDPGAVRRLLVEIFTNEEDLGFFCEDYFPEVIEKFGEGMSLQRKAQTLSQHCLQNGAVDKLIAIVKKNYPSQYQEHQASLFLPETAGAPATSTPVAVESKESQVTALPPTPPLPAAATPPDSQLEAAGSRPAVFISYRRKDLTFVTQLHQELTTRGIPAWFDQENIEVADHWRTSIAEGIRDCKVFVLVLSPDAVESVNIRKEVDLAEKYNKAIVPLMWRNTEIPAAFDYALAGIQYIDFKETASQENFTELTEILKHLIGGASMTQATSNKPIAQEARIPAISKEKPSETGPLKLGELKKKTSINPLALQGLVISGIVITFGLDTADQDRVIDELQWLFHAIDNLLKIRSGEIEVTQPVMVAIPPQAEVKDQRANNQILHASFAPAFANQIEEICKRIKSHLDNLNLVLAREVQLGEAARENLGLQAELRGKRIAIVKELQMLARLINQAYGVLVASPAELVQLLEES